MRKNLYRNLEGDAQTTAAIFTVIMLIVGFAVAGLLFTFTTVLSGQTYNLVEEDLDAIASYTDVNETFVADNTSWVALGNASIKSGSLYLYNTTGYVDNTSEFDVNYTDGTVQLVGSNATLNGTTMCAVYSYDDELVKNAIKSGILSNFEAQEQIGNYTPIIVLAIIITIIIGLIIGGIASRFMGPSLVGRSGGGNDLL